MSDPLWYAVCMTRKAIDPNAAPTLTPQSHQALWLRALGHSTAEVAKEMGIAETTAKEHLHRAYRMLHAKNGVHAIHIAYQLGFFNTPRETEVRRILAKLNDAETKLTAVGGIPGRVYDMAREDLADAMNTKAVVAGSRRIRTGMARALEEHGLSGVNPEFLESVYEGHPDIAYATEEWDWSDPEVSERVFMRTVQDMLGMNEPEFEQAKNNRRGLLGAFWVAHQMWA